MSRLLVEGDFIWRRSRFFLDRVGKGQIEKRKKRDPWKEQREGKPTAFAPRLGNLYAPENHHAQIHKRHEPKKQTPAGHACGLIKGNKLKKWNPGQSARLVSGFLTNQHHAIAPKQIDEPQPSQTADK